VATIGSRSQAATRLRSIALGSARRGGFLFVDTDDIESAALGKSTQITLLTMRRLSGG
jgi:hypothetical protein